MLLYCLINPLGTLQHAWRCTAHHEVILPHGAAVKHGIKRGHFIHTNLWHLEHLGNLVHGVETQPPIVLGLCKREEGDDGR